MKDEKLRREGFYKKEETQDEKSPGRKEYLFEGSVIPTLKDFKDVMSGKTSTQKKKKPRVKPSLEEVTDQAAVKG